MLTTRHPVDFPYTGPELEALFAYAHAHDVERGGRYDARSAAINLWSHHWAHDATRAESDVLGTFYVRWDPPRVWLIEAEAGFGPGGLLGAVRPLARDAPGAVN